MSIFNNLLYKIYIAHNGMYESMVQQNQSYLTHKGASIWRARLAKPALAH